MLFTNFIRLSVTDDTQLRNAFRSIIPMSIIFMIAYIERFLIPTLLPQ